MENIPETETYQTQICFMRTEQPEHTSNSLDTQNGDGSGTQIQDLDINTGFRRLKLRAEIGHVCRVGVAEQALIVRQRQLQCKNVICTLGNI
jgi:hypothetical protein